ncbi:MAG: hypothetical protein WBE83_07145, partial [Candidatus Cybelea sp.]
MRIQCALAATALLAGCAEAGSSVAVTPGMTASALQGAATARIAGAPPRCQGQRSRKHYAQTVTKLKRSGGSICIAEFRGFGGTLEYPTVERSIKLTNRTTVADIYNEPELGSGTPLLYLNLHFSKNTRFGASVPSQGGLESAKFVSGQAYTAFGQVQVGHLAFM